MTVARGATKKRLQRWCHCNDSRSSSGNFPQHFPNSHFPKGERDGRRPFVTKILQTSFCRTFCNTQWVKINQNISFLHWKSCGFKSHFEHFLAKILGSNPNVRLFWVIFNHCVTSKVHFYSSFRIETMKLNGLKWSQLKALMIILRIWNCFALFCKETKTQW